MVICMLQNAFLFCVTVISLFREAKQKKESHFQFLLYPNFKQQIFDELFICNAVVITFGTFQVETESSELAS